MIRTSPYSRAASAITILFLLVFAAEAQKRALVNERDVRAEMQFLAGDAMQGRASGSAFERIAAEYIGSQFMQFGLEPAGENGWDGKPTFVRTIELPERRPLSSLTVTGAGSPLELGRDFAVMSVGAPKASGKLLTYTEGSKPPEGSVILIRPAAGATFRSLQPTISAAGATKPAAIIIQASSDLTARWDSLAERRPNLGRGGWNMIVVAPHVAEKLAALPADTQISMAAEFAPAAKAYTWNAVGKLTGSDRTLASEVIVLSSHLDHIGVNPSAPGDDKIFNGADDDASGSVAVLELARAIASGKRPKRTIYFVCFGSEESGGHGSRGFLRDLPFPREKFIANLQFEMIGRPDRKVKPNELWLTGYERSNLGAELARRGAFLVADPHPEENFFQRSDNYGFAVEGIVAHTVSSFGLHPDYHQAGDEVRTIDFAHMTNAISSMIKPIQSLANSTFRPEWTATGRPARRPN